MSKRSDSKKASGPSQQALNVYTRSPNIGYEVVEALLLLRSVLKKLPNTFDQLAKQHILDARSKAKAKAQMNQGQFLDDDVDLSF